MLSQTDLSAFRLLASMWVLEFPKVEWEPETHLGDKLPLLRLDTKLSVLIKLTVRAGSGDSKLPFTYAKRWFSSPHNSLPTCLCTTV